MGTFFIAASSFYNSPRKIKRGKTNLYRKKKTKGQKIFATVLLIIIIAALGFLGYCLGKPLLEYLGKERKSLTWTPLDEVAETAELPETTTAPAETEPPATLGTTDVQSEDSPAFPTELVAYSAPSGALANKAALSAALLKAKNSGYTSISVQLKDEAGFFHYATEIKGAKDYGLVKGDMTAAEIVSAFLENDMIPTARISVLADSEGTKYFSGLNYKCYGDNFSWLDYSQETPTLWINPDTKDAEEYVYSIVSELKNAGFMNIILENVIYPNFQHYDTQFILQKYFEKDRYKYLFNVIPEGTVVEMNAADILAEEFGRTAEPLYDTHALTLNKVAVVINRTDFPASEGNPADAASLTENVMTAVSKKTGGLTLIPVIGMGFAGSDTASIAEALKKMGYTDYMVINK